MLHTREEEIRQAQRLHLLPDERDKAVQITAKGKAGSVVALFSLLFCAACILQGSSTWTAFLSLAFSGFAAQNFYQFACDRERFVFIYLMGGWLFLFQKFSQNRSKLTKKLLTLKLARNKS